MQGLWDRRRTRVLPAVPGNEQPLAFKAQSTAAAILEKQRGVLPRFGCFSHQSSLHLYLQITGKKDIFLKGSLRGNRKPASANICRDLYILFKFVLSSSSCRGTGYFWDALSLAFYVLDSCITRMSYRAVPKGERRDLVPCVKYLVSRLDSAK